MRRIAFASLLLAHPFVRAEVIYRVYSAATNPTCDSALDSGGMPGNTLPDAAAIGSCQDFGKGKSAYNSIEILGCSSTCLCFRQYASEASNPSCDESLALGTNIKEACFDECKADCNGPGCGETTTLEQSQTRLALLGEGQICAQPQAAANYSCATTGMIKELTTTTADSNKPADGNKTDNTVAANSAGPALLPHGERLLLLAMLPLFY
eukprot:gb/GFBE01022976.1/.p1 GENE.gb/GFBE01022976.1/~~gb/GFBE01022976.1/.p1  ORF type:complete len:209 (+),score=34.68 gb/GFBE01022976.1/:1-627(+)